MTLPLAFTPEVRAALDAGKPVVALESTIITHGMPFPQNVQADVRSRPKCARAARFLRPSR